MQTHLENADLSGCHVYGISAWDVHLDGAKQTGLVITPEGTAEITVDDLEVAQFIYLAWANEWPARRGSIERRLVGVTGCRFSSRRQPSREGKPRA